MKHMKKVFSRKENFSLKEHFNMVMTAVVCFLTGIFQVRSNGMELVKGLTNGQVAGAKTWLWPGCSESACKVLGRWNIVKIKNGFVKKADRKWMSRDGDGRDSQYEIGKRLVDMHGRTGELVQPDKISAAVINGADRKGDRAELRRNGAFVRNVVWAKSRLPCMKSLVCRGSPDSSCANIADI